MGSAAWQNYSIFIIFLCKELEAYGSVISAFRAQGQLTKDKKCSLEVLCKCLGLVTLPNGDNWLIFGISRISAERHRAEVRRAVNDELLSVVACWYVCVL